MCPPFSLPLTEAASICHSVLVLTLPNYIDINVIVVAIGWP
ncbi:hypothetical protein FHW00_004419 [Ochrobactrum sp. P6BSIII]|nr:hypothetical protein [Ochrobactrum sp. P6BSIII]